MPGRFGPVVALWAPSDAEITASAIGSSFLVSGLLSITAPSIVIDWQQAGGVRNQATNGCRRDRGDNDDHPDSLSFRHSNTDNSLDEPARIARCPDTLHPDHSPIYYSNGSLWKKITACAIAD